MFRAERESDGEKCGKRHDNLRDRSVIYMYTENTYGLSTLNRSANYVPLWERCAVQSEQHLRTYCGCRKCCTTPYTFYPTTFSESGILSCARFRVGWLVGVDLWLTATASLTLPRRAFLGASASGHVAFLLCSWARRSNVQRSACSGMKRLLAC